MSIRIGILVLIVFLLIGVGITKFTVQDLVPADADRTCIDLAINKPIQKLSLEWLIRATGKTQIVTANSYGGEAKVYTLFRIPLNFFTILINCDPGLKPALLTDGERIDWLGVFHAEDLIIGGLKSYTSEELGISLKYPNGYLLFDNQSEEGAAPEFHNISIGPEGPILQTISRARAGFAGEGPYTINVAFYHEPTLKVANIVSTDYLKQWLGAHEAQSNFHASVSGDPSLNTVLTPATVDDTPAFRYHNELGLYASDYVAFVYGEWVVIASSATDLGKDFDTVLASIQFNHL